MEVSGADRPVVCVTQARMGSSRLPGKVMLPVLGKPLLWWHLSRLGRAKHIDRLVVATTAKPQDEPIVELGRSMGIAVFRGSEDDVLNRYAEAVAAYEAATVVRVTSDCPLIDPGIVDEAIAGYRAQRPGVDYLTLERADFPRGLDVEVFSVAALAEAERQALDPAEREHVTPYIYRRPERFRCVKLANGAGFGVHRWCVDEPADFELVSRLIAGLAPANPTFTWRDCLALLADHPDWLALNAAVAQKRL